MVLFNRLIKNFTISMEFYEEVAKDRNEILCRICSKSAADAEWLKYQKSDLFHNEICGLFCAAAFPEGFLDFQCVFF